MDGFVSVMGPCFTCGRVFSFNPHRVPSFPTVPDDPKTREPLCRDCVEIVNARRIEAGQTPFTIYPDAYDAIPANEL